jgi:hypothetical protein
MNPKIGENGEIGGFGERNSVREGAKTGERIELQEQNGQAVDACLVGRSKARARVLCRFFQFPGGFIFKDVYVNPRNLQSVKSEDTALICKLLIFSLFQSHRLREARDACHQMPIKN